GVKIASSGRSFCTPGYPLSSIAPSSAAASSRPSSPLNRSSVRSCHAPPGTLGLTAPTVPSGATAICVLTVWHRFLPAQYGICRASPPGRRVRCSLVSMTSRTWEGAHHRTGRGQGLAAVGGLLEREGAHLGQRGEHVAAVELGVPLVQP